MSNIIVPYSAYVWGLEYATIAKLLASVSQLITTILKHTIGFSSMALFSHLKHASDAEKQSIFHSIHRYLFTALFLSILLSGLIYHVAAHYLFTLQAHTVVIVLFLAVLTIENCFIACESAYLAEERSHAFALLSIIGVGAAYGLFHYQLINHVVIMLTTFIALRLASLSILSIMLTNRWKVPAYKEK